MTINECPETIIFECPETGSRLHVQVIRERRDGKPSRLVDLLVDPIGGSLTIGGVVLYAREIPEFWLRQTGGNVWEADSFYDTPVVFRIADDEQIEPD